MYNPIPLTNAIQTVRIFINPSLWRRVFLIVPLALTLTGFALAPAARAVTPAPDGGYRGGNTAEGEDALFNLTTGIDNTAIGYNALYSNTAGGGNTASGGDALYSNTTGSDNTAIGELALVNNTTGSDNTATGFDSLSQNVTGSGNTATGDAALFSNRNGDNNTANGAAALGLNTRGSNNTADGVQALLNNTTGVHNTATGQSALYNNTTGAFNIALGANAGYRLTTGSNNIDIGNRGVAGEANTIRLGTNGTHTTTFIAGINGVTVPRGVAVIVDSNGRLGTITSSKRAKEEIKPMDQASEAILALKPVTFRYKHELDPDRIAQFGLVAEEVEKVNPDLVARDEQGRAYTVRYEAVNAMLLNEFLKEHRKVEKQEQKNEEQQATIAQLKSAWSQQQKEIGALTASLKEQAAQIKRVSDELEVSRSAPQVVAHNQ